MANNVKMGQATVQAAAIRLDTLVNSTPPPGQGILWRLVNPGATNTIYLGYDATVDATHGYPLAPGKDIWFEMLDAGKKIYVFGTAADKLGWMVTLA